MKLEILEQYVYHPHVIISHFCKQWRKWSLSLFAMNISKFVIAVNIQEMFILSES
jgi:hypothetical protein